MILGEDVVFQTPAPIGSADEEPSTTEKLVEALNSLSIPSPVTYVLPADIKVPAPLVEFDLSELAVQMEDIRALLRTLISVMQSPVQRIVARDSDGLIQSVTERRM